MAQAFKPDVQIVEVLTDELVGGVAKREYWAAAAAPEQAVQLVLASVPEGWAAALSDERDHTGLKLQPGDARLIR